MISTYHGTWRGFVRLQLARAELMLGRGGEATASPGAVRRLVFVCHGNICRSAFAEVAARRAGLNAVSIGLSTSSGKPAHPPAVAAAAAMGFDLSGHRSTAVADYVAEEGDLLLAMETRQMRRIGGMAGLGDLPRELLGRYAAPPAPHLHDPYQLSDAYMLTCLRRIESAVPALHARFVNARAA